MDLHDALDDLTSMIENARAMPMSASCMINRGDAQSLLNRVRDMLPEELQHAELLLREREAVIEEGRREAERILNAAQEECAALLAQAGLDRFNVPDQRGAPYPPAPHEYPPAHHEDADRAAAIIEADSIRRQADEYVDQQLATLEVILNKALASVQRGRDRLPGRGDAVMGG